MVVISEIAASAICIGQAGRPSATALEMTAYRAIGAKHPDNSIRNEDHLAERLLGPEERAVLNETGSQAVLAALALDTEAAWISLGNRSSLARAVHVRTRHIDDVLEESLKTGINQVVNMRAGLDSRAYRFDGALRNARVFELDLPTTQEYKKNRVRQILGSLPGHVTYVPIDFAKQDLGTVLAAAGYDRNIKTIFIWEGVTRPDDYLERIRSAVADLIRGRYLLREDFEDILARAKTHWNYATRERDSRGTDRK